MNRILIAEDEERIASFVQRGLRGHGFVTTVVGDGEAAYTEGVSGSHDLLVLDIGLPRVDGFTVLRRLREARVTMPVVILTARDSVGDTVAGLESGADDYLAKPFAFEELLARIRLRLRGDGTGTADANVLRVGDLTLDLRTRRALVAGSDGRPDGPGVPAGRSLLPAPGPGAVPRAVALAGLGFRLRPGLERGGRLHPLPTPQTRPEPNRNHPRHGLPLATLELSHLDLAGSHPRATGTNRRRPPRRSTAPAGCTPAVSR